MALDIRPYFANQAGAAPAGGPMVSVRDTGAATLSGALAQVAQAADLMAEEEATRTADVALIEAAKAQSDFQESLRARQDYGAFVEDYQRTWSQQKASILGNLSSRARRKVESKLAYMEVQGLTEVRGLAWRKQTDVGRAQLITQTDQAFEVIGRDPFGETAAQAFDGLRALYSNAAANGLITQEAAASARENLEQRLGVTQVSALIDQNPYQAKKRLGAGEFDSLLQPEKKAALLNLADAGIREREAEAKRRQAERDKAADYERQLAAAELEVAVARGQAGETDILKALDARIITPGQAADLRIKNDKRTADALATQKMVERVTGALSGETPPLNPGSADDVKAVNVAFDGWSGTIADRPPEEQATLIADWVGRAGILPEGVEKMLRGGARGSADQVLAAADLYGRLQEQSPALVHGLEGRDYTYLATVQGYVESGVDGRRAVELASANVLDAKQPEKQERADRWAAEKLGDAARTFLADEANDAGWLSPSLPLPDGLAGEFAALARSYFIETGDAEIANRMAWQDIQNIWGRSEVGGGWMRYPPERVYGAGEADASWMQDQLKADIRALGLAPTNAALAAIGLPGDALDFEVRLVPHKDAARQAQPGYYVEILNPEGVWEQLFDRENGGELVWRPDYSVSPAAKKAKAEAEADIEAGRQDRQDRLQTDERMGPQSPLDSFVPAVQ